MFLIFICSNFFEQKQISPKIFRFSLANSMDFRFCPEIISILAQIFRINIFYHGEPSHTQELHQFAGC